MSDKIIEKNSGKHHAQKARVNLIIAVVIFGTLGMFTRNISVASSELALYRAILATVMIVAYHGIVGKRIQFKVNRRELLYLGFSGVAMGINWILLFEAYKYTTISAATISYYFAPTLVTIACCFLFAEKLTGKKALCFLMSTVGLILTIGIENMERGSSDLKGVLFGLSAAVFYAVVILLNKSIQTVVGIERTLLQFGFCIIVLLPYVLLTNGVTLGQLDRVGWVCLVIVGIVHTGITYCLYFSAIKDLPGQETAILSYIDPLVAVGISVFILGERITVLQTIGAMFILGFTLWNEIPAKECCEIDE